MRFRASAGGERTSREEVSLWGGEFFFPDRMIAERAGGLLRGSGAVSRWCIPDRLRTGDRARRGDGMVFDSRENRRRYRVPIVKDGPFR